MSCSATENAGQQSVFAVVEAAKEWMVKSKTILNSTAGATNDKADSKADAKARIVLRDTIAQTERVQSDSKHVTASSSPARSSASSPTSSTVAASGGFVLPDSFRVFPALESAVFGQVCCCVALLGSYRLVLQAQIESAVATAMREVHKK